MKKLTQHYYYKFYPNVRLFREDLENLIDIFSNIFSDIEIEADEYKLDKIDEIANINKDIIYNFKIVAYETKEDFGFRYSKISISFDRNYSRLSIDDYSDLRCVAIEKIIDDFINTKYRLLNIFDSKIPFYIITLMMVLFTIFIIFLLPK